MKIALFTDSVGGGGGGRVCGRLSEIWTKLGHEVLLFAESDPLFTDYHFDYVARETVHQVEVSESQMDDLYERYKFDVAVIIGRVVDRNFNGLLRMLKRRHVKVLSMLHHSFSTWLYFLCIGDEYKAREYLNQIDCLVCVEPLQSIWWHEMGARSLWIENPISLKIQDDFVQGNQKRIVWVGRAADPGKRLDLMIDVFMRVLKDIPDARLCILGDIPKKKLSDYSRIHGSLLMSRLECPGFVPDVEKYLRMSDVLAFTSLLEVAVPQVVLEAQACGIPVVAMDMPVLRSMSVNNGVVKCMSIEEMSSELKKLLLDDQLLQSLKESALINAKIWASSLESKQKWCELFARIKNDESLRSYIDKEYERIDTKENLKSLLAEVQRGFCYFGENHYQKLHQTSLRCRFSCMVRRVLNTFSVGQRIIQLRDRMHRR